MLKQRVITALAIALPAVVAIYFLPALPFALLIAAVAALAAYEWGPLAGLTTPAARLALVAGWLVVVGVAMLYPAVTAAFVQMAPLVWLVAALIVLSYPASERLVAQSWISVVLGVAVLWCAWAGVVTLRALPHGANWLLFALVLPVAADVGAYFTGRALGRTKLAPRVSPGKTWEGVAGGAVLAFIVCGGGLALAGQLASQWLYVLPILVAMSVIGDLFESVLKRTSGVKDSGSILPGHGGVLDRVDAIVAVVPLVAFTLSYAGLS